MPMFKRPDAEIHYEVYGSGFPILLYAPGGLKSQMEMWGGTSAAYPNGFPWMDPRRRLPTNSPSSPWTSATPASRWPT